MRERILHGTGWDNPSKLCNREHGDFKECQKKRDDFKAI